MHPPRRSPFPLPHPSRPTRVEVACDRSESDVSLWEGQSKRSLANKRHCPTTAQRSRTSSENSHLNNFFLSSADEREIQLSHRRCAEFPFVSCSGNGPSPDLFFSFFRFRPPCWCSGQLPVPRVPRVPAVPRMIPRSLLSFHLVIFQAALSRSVTYLSL